MTGLLMLPKLGSKELGKVQKKNLYENKQFIFRKVTVLEPAILLKMIFTSSNFRYFPKTLQNNFFTRTTPNAWFSISLCYYLSFFQIKIIYTNNIFDNLCKYSYILHKLFLIVHLSWNIFLRVTGHS